MKPQVLLVDDDPLLLESLKRSLRKEPYNILCATSGEQAMSVLATQQIDLIVSDEKMPGMRGHELLTLVREQYPNTMRIMLSGQPSLDIAVRAINAGEIFRLFVKPCKEVEVALGIRAALQQRELIVQSQRLLRAAQHQKRSIQDLEEAYGSGVSRDESGVIELPEQSEDLEEILREIELQLGLEGPQ
ncbi:MAG: response regulator [Deltaproteobacteria bacterium]|nr:response regulator [Deltaproteobacteria bacterium]